MAIVILKVVVAIMGSCIMSQIAVSGSAFGMDLVSLLIAIGYQGYDDESSIIDSIDNTEQ